MKKYKLIKKYPGSPKLNFEINNKNVFIDFIKPELYPEFWQEIIEKDYEILSLLGVYNSIIHNISNKECIEQLLKSNLKINSVKRLSDGEIFTIGDKIENYNHIIQDFVIIDDKMFIRPKNGGTMYLFPLFSVVHDKKPLFKTEDGVDIYEGNKYFRVISNWTTQQENAIKLGEYIYKSDNILRFSTKKAAEDYIIMNKPCISIMDLHKDDSINVDVANVYDNPWDMLRSIVKKKLNIKD
jgi:hypothetical protein